MSAAAAKSADLDAGAPRAGGGRKKLLIIVVAGVLLLAAVGSAAAWWIAGKPAAAQGEGADEDADPEAAAERRKAERHGAPTFAPLDPFTVNLADREAERYAQVGITLELEEPKDAETVKQYMPAIRNNILMVLAHKTSAELLEREGKLKLAEEIRREALRALGTDAADAAAPVRAVQFSNFIVQ
jgi:flagellar FliL protein